MCCLREVVPSQMCMLHYNQQLQCSLFTPHMESGLRPLLIYYKLCLYHDTKYIIYGVMNLPLSLHFPHSLSISLSPSVPLHLPSPLPLCGVDSLPCQLHLLACGGCHHIVIIIYCDPAHLRIMFSQITCNITCYIFLQCH